MTLSEKTIGKSCAGKPHTRFERGLFSPALEGAQVKEEVLPLTEPLDGSCRQI